MSLEFVVQWYNTISFLHTQCVSSLVSPVGHRRSCSCIYPNTRSAARLRCGTTATFALTHSRKVSLSVLIAGLGSVNKRAVLRGDKSLLSPPSCGCDVGYNIDSTQLSKEKWLQHGYFIYKVKSAGSLYPLYDKVVKHYEQLRAVLNDG